MSTFGRDLRFGARMLLRSPSFTAAAVACLALGIGATTAIFSVVNAVLLRPLPYREPDRLLRLYTEFPTQGPKGLHKFWASGPEYKELKRELKAFESVEAWTTTGVNLGANEPVRVTAALVTGGLLQTLGVAPAAGRLLTPEDDIFGKPRTAVISQGLWKRAFGGDPKVVGRQAKLNGQDCSIVGIMPPGFHFPPGEADPPELWTPVQIEPTRGRANHYLYLLGRLAPGVSAQRAGQDIERAVAALGRTGSERHHVLNPQFHPVVAFSFHEETVGGVRRAMVVLLVAVAFVLLIACVNVANLLLARSESRRREIAVRRAVGAGTGALLRQFLVEGVMLSGVGALLGLGLAFAGLRLILRVDPASIPRVAEISVDWRVLLFTAGVSLLTGVFFGLAPVAQVTAGRVWDALKAAGGRTAGSLEANTMRKLMVAGELALALMLLIGAGLMVRAFWNLQAVDIGMRTERLLTMRVALPRGAYSNEQARQFWPRLEQRLAGLPGVEAATLASDLPPVRELDANDTEIEGFVPRPGGPAQNVDFYQLVGPTFFETAGLRLMEGRFLDRRDSGPNATSVVINFTMAKTFWPDQSAIGRRVRAAGDNTWRTVAGVVGDVKNAGVDKPAGTELFIPYAMVPDIPLRAAWVVVRTQGEPQRLANAVRAEIRALDPALPVAQVRSMDEVLGTATARPRLLTLLLTVFSAVALALAAVGIYGVISYSVARRTNEFGIRMAMGASPAKVLRMVLNQGLALGAAGVAAGTVGAFLLTRFLRGLLFGIDSMDPATFAAMAGTLAAVSLLAALVPAVRATQVSPTVALREE